ncbi:MAG: hypothetical protein ABIC82_00320 [bacterium]
MAKDLSNKEFSLKNAIGSEVKKSSEQISDIPKVPESATETIPQKEQAEKIETKSIEAEKQSAIQKVKEKIYTGGKTSLPSQPLTEDDQFEVKNIESILQEGLEEIYKTMDPVSQAQFKAQGEDTAKAINILLCKTKVKIKEIVDLIIKWLKLIPAVNKFFIEQEAKIKADKLMAQKREKEKIDY